MADSFLVRIDLPKLHEHFADAGSELTTDDILTWLRKNGFLQQLDGSFLCEELSLQLLDRSEIVDKRPV